MIRPSRPPSPSSASAARRTSSIPSACSGSWLRTGMRSMPDGQATDFVVINTCGFIESARQESLGVIREMLDRKRAGELKGVIVAGCLAERQREMLLEEVPEVDQIVGVFGREEIAKVAARSHGRPARAAHRLPARRRPRPGRPRPVADHPQAPGVPQGFRGVRSSLHLLRHPLHARGSTSQSPSRPSSPRPANSPPTASES